MKEITSQLVLAELDDRIEIETIEKFSEDCDELHSFIKKNGESAYVHILLELTHKQYDEVRAKKLWQNIVDHKSELNAALGRNVGISVAALDYMTNIAEEISTAKVIEEDTAEMMAEAATKDALTALYKRAVFDVFLKEQCKEFKRYQRPFSLILFDIDDFKNINDEFGHPEGDRILRKLAKVVDQMIREPDIAARYGGEEFALILTETGENAAITLAERLRKAVEDGFETDHNVTISLGVASCPKRGLSPSEILKSADDALYRSKNAGKNRVSTI